MTNFDKAYKETMQIEGGYANNPNDNGGETYKGVARKFWPQWGGWSKIDAIKKQVGGNAASINREASKDPALQEMVKSFYKTNFWDSIKLGEVKYPSISEELFDTGINMGILTASKFLQEALNLCNKNGQSYPDIIVDGKIGPATLNTLKIEPMRP